MGFVGAETFLVIPIVLLTAIEWEERVYCWKMIGKLCLYLCQVNAPIKTWHHEGGWYFCINPFSLCRWKHHIIQSLAKWTLSARWCNWRTICVCSCCVYMSQDRTNVSSFTKGFSHRSAVSQGNMQYPMQCIENMFTVPFLVGSFSVSELCCAI